MHTNATRSVLSAVVGMAFWSAFSVLPVQAYDALINNPTAYPATVTVWTDRLLFVSSAGTVDIAPGGSYTFSTGGWCPCSMTGEIAINNKKYKLQPTKCIDGGTTDIAENCIASCWKINFSVCQLRGQGSTEVHDSDYGFCKN